MLSPGFARQVACLDHLTKPSYRTPAAQGTLGANQALTLLQKQDRLTDAWGL